MVWTGNMTVDSWTPLPGYEPTGRERLLIHLLDEHDFFEEDYEGHISKAVMQREHGKYEKCEWRL